MLISKNNETRPTKLTFEVYSWAAMLFFLGLLTHLVGTSASVAGPLSVLFQPLAGSLHAAALLVLVSTPLHRRWLSGYFLSNPWMLCSLIVILASTLWSIDAAVTARRSLLVVGTTLTGLAIGFVYARFDYLGFLRRAFLVFIALSFLVAVFLPEYGVHHGDPEHEGRWRGLLSFKNQMAWMVALFLIFWLSRVRWRSLLRPAEAAPIALGAFTLVMCGSATGLLQAAFGIFLLFLLRTYAEKRSLRLPILLLSAAAILAMALLGQVLLSAYLEATSRTDTLSGRTVIWAEVWPYILQRPLLGYGQSAFWEDPSRFFGNSYWISAAHHSHNAYIEVLLDLGIVGLSFQILFLVSLFRSLWRQMRSGSSDAAALFAALAAIVVASMAGAMFFRPNSGIWVLISSISGYAYACQHYRPGAPNMVTATDGCPPVKLQETNADVI